MPKADRSRSTSSISGDPFAEPASAPPRVARLIPRVVAADLPTIITAADRARIASNVDMMLAFLDALDGDPDLDGGQGDDDCCPAGDDNPAMRGGMTGWVHGTGDAADAEEGGDAEPSISWPELCQSGEITALGDVDATDLEGDSCDAEPSDAHDCMGDRLVIVHGGVPA